MRKTMNKGRLAFFNLVKQMRQAQKDFYSTKGQDWQSVRKPLWDKSLALEKRVDEYIAHGDDTCNSINLLCSINK